MILFLGLILLPGVSLASLLHLWKDSDSLVVKLAWSFAIGMAFDVLLGFSRNLIHYPLAATPFIILAFSSLFFGLRFFMKGTFTLNFSKQDIMPLLPSLIILLVASLHFFKYPYFPAYLRITLPASADFENHVNIIDSLLVGMPAIFDQVLYYGIHYLLAMPLAFGGEVLFETRYNMAALTILSPLLIYLAAMKLFDNHRIAWTTAWFYALSGFLWFMPVFVVGLFPNFYGMLSFFLLIAATRHFLTKQVGVPSLVLLLLSVVSAFLSHYTILLVIPFLLVFAVWQSRQEKVMKRGIILIAVLLAPILLGLPFFNHMASFLTGGSESVLFSTTLSQIMPLAILKYMVLEIKNDFLSVLSLFFASLFAWSAFKSRQPAKIAIVLFFIGILVFTPQNPVAWRFAFVALWALMFMVGFVLGSPLRRREFGNKYQRLLRGDPAKSWKAGFVGFLFVFPMLAPSSWTFSDAVSSTSLSSASPLEESSIYRQSDIEVYKAIKWFRANLPVAIPIDEEHERPAIFLSVTDSRFTYSSLMDAQIVLYAPSLKVSIVDPFQIVLTAVRHGADFIIVTNVLTYPVPPELSPWHWTQKTMRCDTCLVYETDYVKIFDLSKP